MILGRKFYSLMTQFPHLYARDDEQVVIWEGGVTPDLPPGLRE